jgi:hypothetical protein
LPPFRDETEPKYLAEFKPEKLGFAYMDRKKVMIGGSRSRVEFCDLYSKAKDIVHVKRYGGSSVAFAHKCRIPSRRAAAGFLALFEALDALSRTGNPPANPPSFRQTH